MWPVVPTPISFNHLQAGAVEVDPITAEREQLWTRAEQKWTMLQTERALLDAKIAQQQEIKLALCPELQRRSPYVFETFLPVRLALRVQVPSPDTGS